MPEPSHFYVSPRCLFCNKNNKRRNTRRGRYWKCAHCGEINPGPGMIKAIVRRFTSPPAGHPHVASNGSEQSAPKAATTKIKGADAKPASKAAAKPAAISPSAAPAPAPPASPPKPEKKRSFIYG